MRPIKVVASSRPTVSSSWCPYTTGRLAGAWNRATAGDVTAVAGLSDRAVDAEGVGSRMGA